MSYYDKQHKRPEPGIVDSNCSVMQIKGDTDLLVSPLLTGERNGKLQYGACRVVPSSGGYHVFASHTRADLGAESAFMHTHTYVLQSGKSTRTNLKALWHVTPKQRVVECMHARYTS